MNTLSYISFDKRMNLLKIQVAVEGVNSPLAVTIASPEKMTAELLRFLKEITDKTPQKKDLMHFFSQCLKRVQEEVNASPLEFVKSFVLRRKPDELSF